MTGYSVIVLAAIIQIASTIFFFSGIPISSFNFWIPLLATIIFLRFMSMYNRETTKQFAWNVAILFIILLVGGFFSYMFYDLSYDGQAYQQETVIQIAKGWNPYTGIPVVGYVHDLWINHYPKGSWILAAAVYKVTNLIETAKVFNFALLISSFFISVSTMLSLFPKNKVTVFLLAFLLAFNPVVLVQLTTFNNDCQVYSLLLIIFCLAFLLFKEFEIWKLVMLCLSLLLLVNTTFLAVGYAIVIFIAYLLTLFIFKKSKLLRRIIWPIVVTFIVGLAIVGYNPYVKNTIDNGNPFYPIMGAGKVDIITSNSPSNFVNSNPVKNIARSLLSRSQNTLTPSQVKFPFTVDKNEIEALLASDVRVGGFGPFFGGIVLLALVSFLISLLKERKKSLDVIFPGAIIVISILINNYAWWASTAPQMWVLPILVAIFAFSFKNKLTTCFSWITVVILLVNILLVSNYHFREQYALSRQVDAQLAQLKSSGKDIEVQLNNHLSNRIRFEEKDINHTIVPQVKCKNPPSFPLSDAKYCE